MPTKKEIGGIIISAILPGTLIVLGSLILEREAIIGVITILSGFLFLYFVYYSYQIRSNEKKIKLIEDWIEQKEELLNTLKEIVLLKKVSQI